MTKLVFIVHKKDNDDLFKVPPMDGDLGQVLKCYTSARIPVFSDL